eukprot:jgi/Hompol1/2197/HPOL_002078-RA
MPAPPLGCQDPKCQTPQPGVYDVLAPEYDAKLGWDEYWLGIGNRRTQLLGHALGDVLEVSAGTGRNFPAYNSRKITSLTLTDTSAPMLIVARTKFITTHRKEYPESRTPQFVVMNSEHLLADSQQYDTVVDTFGLCSHRDPVMALKEMARVCRSTGNILLLEHGRSSFQWLNNALDKLAPQHASKWGCWWNRDILGLVAEAGLTVVESKRYHFGTTYAIIAKPPAAAAAPATRAAVAEISKSQ